MSCQPLHLAARTAATLLPLKPVQVLERALRPLRGVWAARVPDLGVPRLRPRSPVLPAGAGHGRLLESGFSFAGETRRLEGEDRWNPAGAPRLWTYTLHYFQWLHALPRPAARARVLDWIGQNPPGTAPGWDPYPIALRLREWIEWLLPATDVPAADRDRILASLARQTEALHRQLEHHLQGNHLLEDAIGLCWAGLGLAHPRADAWLRRGLDLLRREVRRQVLPDGTHEERTPGYQARLAEALLRLRDVARASPGAGARRVASVADAGGTAMVRALGPLTHPDGDVAAFGDTALGLDATRRQLAERFGFPATLAEGPWELPDGRFLGWRGAAGDYVAFDVGGIGPRHQPGHGHAGALAFAWSLAGERLVTDTGVFTYERDGVRAYDRSTAAHTTVEVDDCNQSDVWAAFRCGRRIRAYRPRWHDLGDAVVLEGGYAGPGRDGLVHHARRLTISRQGIEVADLVRCRGRHVAKSRIHLAPDVDVRPERGGFGLMRDGRRVAHLESAGPAFHVTCTPYHPTFGVEVERVTLVAEGAFDTRWIHRWELTVV